MTKRHRIGAFLVVAATAGLFAIGLAGWRQALVTDGGAGSAVVQPGGSPPSLAAPNSPQPGCGESVTPPDPDPAVPFDARISGTPVRHLLDDAPLISADALAAMSLDMLPVAAPAGLENRTLMYRTHDWDLDGQTEWEVIEWSVRAR